QPTVAGHMDIAKVAEGCAYPNVISVDTHEKPGRLPAETMPARLPGNRVALWIRLPGNRAAPSGEYTLPRIRHGAMLLF
ncbi:MAG: hypothetical protein IJI45_19060, partial [Anaerolineaceae bacterium]|nr:hypothetical protein [Anaerolineaceae bacterium]